MKTGFETDAIIPTDPDGLQASESFDELVALALRTLASANSPRAYRQTYNLWRAYCDVRDLAPLEMTPAYIIDFLDGQNTTKATRQRQLSALRKLAQMTYILTPDDHTRRLYEALKIIKAPSPGEAATAQERTRIALTPARADQMLRLWDGDGALVSVLLLGGIRRSEAAALRWADVDFENGILNIRDGKGDKSRDVALAGEYAPNALHVWQAIHPSGFQYVFTPVNRGGKVRNDKPIAGRMCTASG